MARTVIDTGLDQNIRLLESGDDRLLESGDFRLLEEAATVLGRSVISSRTVIGTSRSVISTSRSVI
jgi:hypothetical protein